MAVSTFYYIMLSKDHAICQPIVIGLSFTKIIKKLEKPTQKDILSSIGVQKTNVAHRGLLLPCVTFRYLQITLPVWRCFPILVPILFGDALHTILDIEASSGLGGQLAALRIIDAVGLLGRRHNRADACGVSVIVHMERVLAARG